MDHPAAAMLERLIHRFGESACSDQALTQETP